MAFDSTRHWLCFVTGGLLLKAGRLQQAAAMLSRAAELDPRHAMTQSSRAIALLKLGRWEDAAAGFAAAIRLDSADAESRANLVMTLLHLARWDEAVVVAGRAIGSDPGRAILHEHLGIALVKLERWQPALDALTRAVELSPESTQATTLRYYALLKLERWEEAIDAIRFVMAQEPNSAELHKGLAVVLARLERWEEAATAIQRALPLEPDRPEGYFTLASYLLKISASAERLAAEQRLAGAAPDDAAAQLRLGVAASALGEWDVAVTALERGSSLVQVDNVFQHLLVDPLMRLGRRQEALAADRRALAAGRPRPKLPGEALGQHLKRRSATFWRPGNLRPEVFRIDQWLARLAPPGPSPDAAGPRLLFLLDADFGELTTLMYLVLGRSLYGQSTLLLPDRLYERNPEALRGRTYRYKSVDDVLQHVDHHRPDVVFLCSGYLLSAHLLFSIEDLERLVKTLRERGCRLVTADPFLGMFSKRHPRDLVAIDIPAPAGDQAFMEHVMQRKRAEDERLWTHFTACERIFRDTYHLYPAYCDVPQPEVTATDVRNLSFFNPELICPELPSIRPAGGSNGQERPHWLFVLSRTDFETQQMFETLPAFINLVVDRLMETMDAGRHPILIAPGELVEAIGHRMPFSEDVDLLAFCPFNQFTSLLLSAEYAFYWNMLSHSLLIRLFNRLPTIVFDRGHLIRNVPAMYSRVVQWYYQGWEPALVDHRQPLTLESLAAWTESYRQNANRIAERFRRAPTPEQMVDFVLANDPMAASRGAVGSDLGR